jgi:hypothetical protein
MLNSTVLDVALGMVFCWGAVSLIASSVYEAIASALKMRASDLLKGLKELLNDKTFTGLAKSVYTNALVNPRDPGRAADQGELTAKPSYIDPLHFAAALIEAVQALPTEAADLKTKIDQIPDEQIRRLLQGMYARAEGNAEEIRKQLASWFSAAMDRVSGVYKRRAQVFSFLIAFAVAAALRIDTFHLFSALWAHPVSVASLAVPSLVTQAVADLKTLPIGGDLAGQEAWRVVLGWVATACSALFGAPFWFGLLQRLTNLRGAGPKPATNNV